MTDVDFVANPSQKLTYTVIVGFFAVMYEKDKTLATKTDKNQNNVKKCAVGTVLFREGESGDRMYVIKSGMVRITKRVVDQDVIVEELGPGEFCGEISLVNQQARPVTAVVVHEADVIPIDAKQFENMIKSKSDIAVRMLKKMSERLTRAHYRTTNLSLRTSKARLLHQLYSEVRASSRFDELGFEQARPIPDNLPEALLLELGEIKDLLSEFTRNELISIDRNGYYQIRDAEGVQRYLKYLELRDRYEA